MAGGFTTGGNRPQSPKRVVRTGIALVHENEIVYPAAGSASQATQAIDDANGEVQVHFPVIIEISSDSTRADENFEASEDTVLRALEEAFRRQ